MQLPTFNYYKQRFNDIPWMREGGWASFFSAVCSSLTVIVMMEPLDVVRTRLYNQPVDDKGRGKVT